MFLKCNFCYKDFTSIHLVQNYSIRKEEGKFYTCSSCKVMIQPKKFRNLYDNQDSSNYNLKKNLFYYFKQIIFFYFILRLRKFFKKKKDILDYGCGSGELAVALSSLYENKNIFTSDVFKLNKKFIPKIKKHFLLNKDGLSGKKFDVILMRHVFEHIFNLDKFLKVTKKNLKDKESVLIIEVPNMDSIWRKIMRNRWPGYFYPFHYYVFSRKFLFYIFNKNGLEVICEKYSEPPIIGTYLTTFNLNKYFCKIISIFFYPLQFLISKIFFSTEALIFIVKKK